MVNDKETATKLVMKHITPGTLFSAGMRFYQVKDSLTGGKPITLQKTSGGNLLRDGDGEKKLFSVKNYETFSSQAKLKSMNRRLSHQTYQQQMALFMQSIHCYNLSKMSTLFTIIISPHQVLSFVLSLFEALFEHYNKKYFEKYL